MALLCPVVTKSIGTKCVNWALRHSIERNYEKYYTSDIPLRCNPREWLVKGQSVPLKKSTLNSAIRPNPSVFRELSGSWNGQS